MILAINSRNQINFIRMKGKQISMELKWTFQRPITETRDQSRILDPYKIFDRRKSSANANHLDHDFVLSSSWNARIEAMALFTSPRLDPVPKSKGFGFGFSRGREKLRAYHSQSKMETCQFHPVESVNESKVRFRMPLCNWCGENSTHRSSPNISSAHAT